MPLIDEDDPHSWDLCSRHAARVSVPQGWELIRQEFEADEMTALLETVQPNVGDSAADSRVVRLSAVRGQSPVSRAVSELTDTISRLDRKGRSEQSVESDESQELEAFEQSLVSPLVEEARARAQQRRQWRGRGEEVVVRSSPVAGQAAGAVSSSSEEETAAPWRREEDDVVVHHPALKNLPGRRRYQLHSVPSGRSE